MDTARAPAVWAARRGYLLPYFHARMSRRRAGAEVRFESTRRDRSGPPARFSGAYQATGPTAEDPLARWLAERYCLYVVDRGGHVLRGDIHHPPWKLQPAECELAAQGMATPLGIDLEGTPLLHYSARQDVLFWRLARA